MNEILCLNLGEILESKAPYQNGRFTLGRCRCCGVPLALGYWREPFVCAKCWRRAVKYSVAIGFEPRRVSHGRAPFGMLL